VIILRGGLELEDPLDATLRFVEAYPGYDAPDSRPSSFDESDLRHANRGGARISAAQIAAILERRRRIERALRSIAPDASLADAEASIPWRSLTRLFDAFADISGVGFSKMTKALHPKRAALIPLLDSVVQEYLATEEPEPGSFGERATALLGSYKHDLDRNLAALRQIQRELVRRGYRPLTEVRILDVLVWSAHAPVRRDSE
jgi:hypothetical protein